MKRLLLSALLLPATMACPSTDEGTVLRHEFPALTAPAASEVRWLCQSWTLGNEESIYVNEAEMWAGDGWHHSNWFWVPEGWYDGPDGTWNCDDRGFDEVPAALAGGVVFAQSTQVANDLQRFAAGAVVELPPNSRIVGNIHLLNVTASDFETSLTLEVRGIPESEAQTKLKPAGFFYFPLDIPPQTKSRFTADCDLATPNEGPLDFNVYYFLPHYHDYGTGMTLQATGGPNGTVDIFENDSLIGEALGRGFDPAIDVTGSTHLRIGCDYNNDTQSRVGYGWADGEMCEALIFTDDDAKWLMQVPDSNQVLGVDADGVVLNAGPCEAFRL